MRLELLIAQSPDVQRRRSRG